jgi:uncharacterized protein involved in exopolysaccharide biosynthesis
MGDGMTGPSLLQTIRRWWWLLSAAALIAAGVAWAFAASADRTYEAETKLLVGPVSGDYPTLQAAGALGRTYAELAHSRRIVADAARSVGQRLSPKEVEGAVNATSNDVTRIVEVRARRGDPVVAARLANALAAQLLRLRRSVPEDPVATVMGDPRIVALPRLQREAVQEAVARVVVSTNPGSLEVVERAVPPRSPVSPKVMLLVLLGALAGALAAAVYAILQEGAGDASAEPDEPHYFEVERFAEPPAESDLDGDLAIERWLGAAGSREDA